MYFVFNVIYSLVNLQVFKYWAIINKMSFSIHSNSVCDFFFKKSFCGVDMKRTIFFRSAFKGTI